MSLCQGPFVVGLSLDSATDTIRFGEGVRFSNRLQGGLGYIRLHRQTVLEPGSLALIGLVLVAARRF